MGVLNSLRLQHLLLALLLRIDDQVQNLCLKLVIFLHHRPHLIRRELRLLAEHSQDLLDASNAQIANHLKDGDQFVDRERRWKYWRFDLGVLDLTEEESAGVESRNKARIVHGGVCRECFLELIVGEAIDFARLQMVQIDCKYLLFNHSHSAFELFGKFPVNILLIHSLLNHVDGYIPQMLLSLRNRGEPYENDDHGL